MAAASSSPLPNPPQLVDTLQSCIANSTSRLDFWIAFLNASHIKSMAEVGVYRGEFAAAMLAHCPALAHYYMLDPWRHLASWQKPANQDDLSFNTYLEETRTKTSFAADKTILLRGTTTEVVQQIPDNALDFAYIDADHTLKGITIDLVRLFPKVHEGGFLAGDDFCSAIWQHPTRFEPTLVFPFAVYFAEATGSAIYALPHAQFCLQKSAVQQFAFVDLTGHYRNAGLKDQLAPGPLLKLLFGERFPRLAQAARSAARILRR